MIEPFDSEDSNPTFPVESSAKVSGAEDKSHSHSTDPYEGVRFGGEKERQVDYPATISLKNPKPRTNPLLVSERPRIATDPAPGLGVMLGKIMWLSAAVFIVCGIWYVGPRVVEEYHYAAVRGKTRAQYDVAKVALDDNPLTNLSTAFEFVASRIRPSVVHIDTSSKISSESVEYAVPGIEYDSRGQGSGVIMDKEGYILTNDHVVVGADEIFVTLFDRRQFKARVIGTDQATDLAVIKIDTDASLLPATWGDSDELTFGSLVWAVGSPFGLSQSVTHGIVSASHRRVENPFQDLIQSDAPINPGNSGGPLVNSQGEVVGINTSILGKGFRGVSFSVSSVVAKNVYERLCKYGKVDRGFLGVRPNSVTHLEADKLQLPSLSGAMISLVERGSPAAKAGILAGDVIVEWDGFEIESDVTLFRQVALTEINTEVNVVVFRDGAPLSLPVVVSGRAPLVPVRRR